MFVNVCFGEKSGHSALRLGLIGPDFGRFWVTRAPDPGTISLYSLGGEAMTSFLGELRRRNVVKVAVAYIYSVDADRLCRVSIPLPNKALVTSERFMRPSHQQFLTLASCMRL